MPSKGSQSRRQFIKYGAASVTAMTLAGCSGDGGDGGDGGSGGDGSGDGGSGGDGTATSPSDDTLRVAATMPSALDDLGWSQAESQSIRNAVDNLDGVELTNIVGAVTYDNTESVISDLAADNDVVIADSNGRLGTGTLAVSQEMPDTHFMTRNTALPPDDLPENHIVYNQHLGMVGGPQAYAASLLPGTETLGIVDSLPVLVREHALRGAKCGIEAAEGEELLINWINAWYDPEATRRNTQSLIDQGADAILNGTNGAVQGQVAAENDIMAVGYGIDMSQAAPEGYATSILMHPEPIFEEGLVAARDGEWADYWNRYDNHHPWAPKDYAGEGTIGLADWHDDVPEDVRSQVEDYVEQADNYEIEYPEVWQENVCPDGTEFELTIPSQ